MRRALPGLRLLITGASGGIGRCLAERVARAGARAVLLARSAEKLEPLARELNALVPGSEKGPAVVAVSGDVTVEADRQRALQAAVENFGGLDVLVNNAGVGSFGHFATSSEEVLRKVMEVNFFAPAELMRAAIPLLRQGRQGAILNVASMCGRRGVPAWSEYSASKFALCGLTDALRAEMARFDLDVLLIVPGLTRSDLNSNLLRNEGRLKLDPQASMAPEVVARGIVNALVRNRRETVLGWEARWILRAQRIVPWLVDRVMARRVRQLYAS